MCIRDSILKVLRREKPDRYTLFEFFLNQDLYNVLSGHVPGPGEQEKALEYMVQAFYRTGYDYVTIHASNFNFPHKNNDHAKSSISVNEGAVITDWESYEAYHWPVSYTHLDVYKRQMMDDSMSSQKLITSTYNTYANECASNQLRST